MNDLIESLNDKIKYAELIVKRLDALSYKVTSEDEFMIMFTAQKIEQHIKNVCNLLELPEGLKYVYVDMVCGEFLQCKYNLNQLDDDNFSIDDAVSVSLGDASVSFGDASSSKKFDTLFDCLMNSKAGELVCYRKIRW